MTSPLARALTADAAAVGVALAPAEVERLLAYAALLAKWNPRIRLVGPDDVDTIVREQVVDALGFVPALRAQAHVATWIDVGAGGGLPGLVAAVLEPGRHWILVEPIAKKTAFLTSAAIALGLTNVTIHTGRVERRDGRSVVEPALPARAPAPTGALARATFAPPAWLALAEPLVGPGGVVLIAVASTDEIPAVVTGDATTRRWDYRVPATGAPRVLVARAVPAAVG